MSGIARLLPRAAPRFAAAWLILIVTGVVLGPLLVMDPFAQDLAATMSGPSASHWLGTDALGRDVLARLLEGGRPTLLGVVVAVLVYLVLGVPLGVVSGYFGGWADRVVTLLAELLFATPAIIILLVVLAVFGDAEVVAMATLGVLGSGGLIRVVRATTAP